jgi:hypothetical protein
MVNSFAATSANLLAQGDSGFLQRHLFDAFRDSVEVAPPCQGMQQEPAPLTRVLNWPALLKKQ